MTFKNGVVPKDWRSAVNFLLPKGKGERVESSNYRTISLLIKLGWKNIWKDPSRQTP